MPKLPNFPGLGKKAKALPAGGDGVGKKVQLGMKPIVVNGDTESDKKPATVVTIENTNGPLLLDGNGSIISDQDRGISESPATVSELSGPSDTQSVSTADSIDLDDARTHKKPSLEIENRSVLQVSTV